MHVFFNSYFFFFFLLFPSYSIRFFFVVVLFYTMFWTQHEMRSTNDLCANEHNLTHKWDQLTSTVHHWRVLNIAILPQWVREYFKSRPFENAYFYRPAMFFFNFFYSMGFFFFFIVQCLYIVCSIAKRTRIWSLVNSWTKNLC